MLLLISRGKEDNILRVARCTLRDKLIPPNRGQSGAKVPLPLYSAPKGIMPESAQPPAGGGPPPLNAAFTSALSAPESGPAPPSPRASTSPPARRRRVLRGD